MVQDQVSTEGVTKDELFVTLTILLGQSQTDVRGRCIEATAISCYVKVQDAYYRTFVRTLRSPVAQTVIFSSSTARIQRSSRQRP